MARQLFWIYRLRQFILCALLLSAPALSFSEVNWLEDNKFVQSEYSQKISMDFKDASLNDILKIFSQQSGTNFIAAENITNKKITMFLDKVPVEEALERILDANNLTYEIQPGSDIFVVKAKAEGNLVTRVYQLKHATVSSSKLKSTFSISESSGSSSSGSSSGGSASSSSGSSSGGSSGSAGGGGIIPALLSVITKDGKIVEDPRTNSLIISDIESQFPKIEETLAKLDVPIAQILIEVEMLDISKGSSEKLGIKLGEQPLTFKGGERDVTYPWDQHLLLDKGYKFAAPEYRVGTISAVGLTAALNFLRTQTDTKNLARPRILTLNNETAQIQISTDEAVGISTSATATTGTTTEEAERTNTGVFLTVTPQANVLTGEITLAITPKVIVARDSNIKLGGNTLKDPEERGMKSILKVQSGETIILGGLLRENDRNIVTKYPFLGDIPIVGAAFRHKEKTSDDRELMIFLTPHILDERNKGKVAPPLEKIQALSREQDVPKERLDEVSKELDMVEEKL